MKGGEFIDHLSGYYHYRKDSVPIELLLKRSRNISIQETYLVK
jgi:hypothetical protein